MLKSMSKQDSHERCPLSVSRRHWVTGCSLLAASLSMATWPAMGAPEKPRLSVVLDDRSSLTHWPVLLAEQLGFFKAEGLTIDFVEQSSEVNAMSALINGSADILCAPYDIALLLKHKGFDAVALAQVARTPQWALGISNKHLPYYTSFADLQGKRVGVMDTEGSAQRCLSATLLRSGIKPSQINWVNLSSALHGMVALRSGSLDALFASDPLMTALEKKDDVSIFSNFRTLKYTQRVFGGILPGNSLLVSQAMVKQHPQTCQSLVNAVVRALKWVRTAGPSDVLRTMVDSAVLPDRLVYLNAIDNMRESYSLDGWLSPEAQQSSLRMLVLLDPAMNTLSTSLPSTVRNDFVRLAKQRFHV